MKRGHQVRQVSHKPGSVCKPFPWNALVQLLSHSCVMITKVHLPPFVLLTKQHAPVPHTLTNTLAECSHYTGLDRLVYAKSVTTTLNKTRPDDLPFCPNYIALCMWHLALINSMDAFFKAVGMITPCSHALSDSRESLIWKMISVVLLIVLRVNVCFNLRLSAWL